MKVLFLILTLSLSLPAMADKILVKSFSQYELWGRGSASPAFQVNPELGRAWVEITVYKGEDSDEMRIKMDGLSYDHLTETINLDYQGKITTCAVNKLVGRSIFRQRIIKMTPACEFQGKWRDVTYDDGFEIKKTRRYDIFLVVKE
jgi:hypothetical protein